MTIYLFGDSYVAPEEVKYLGIEDHKRWYDILSEEQNEQHINYGECGSGPVEAMTHFQRCLEDGFLTDQKVVMVLSNPFRIPWARTFNNGRHGLAEHDYEVNSAGIYQDYFSKPDKIEPKLKNSIKDLYDCMWEELCRTNYKNICYLSHMSKVHSIKMIVFIVYDQKMYYTTRKKIYPKINTSELIYELESLNNDSFYYYKTPLFEYSKNEEDDSSYLLNHLSIYNHTILSNVISNFFYNTNYDTEFFIPIKKSHKTHIDFIYE